MMKKPFAFILILFLLLEQALEAYAYVNDKPAYIVNLRTKKESIMTLNYNKPFFSLYESIFEVLSEQQNEKEALKFMELLFSNALSKSYNEIGFNKGSISDFIRVVKSRDEAVGLDVELINSHPNSIIYRFHTDPFPNLKGKVDPILLSDTYIKFKVKYLLGDEWFYSTTKHFWKNDLFIEHIIRRN